MGETPNLLWKRRVVKFRESQMRILDEDNDRPLDSVVILLTPEESHELLDSLKQLTPAKGDHIHVNDKEFTRGITLAIYTPENLKFFHERIRRLVETEE
jgi:hypothetical protein